MIQILTYSGRENSFKGNDVILSSIHDAKALDDFNINLINLADEDMWVNEKDNKSSLDSIEDLRSLSVMIKNSKKTKIVILIPQNVTYYYELLPYQGKYRESCELKNMLKQLTEYILARLYARFASISLCYENTSTKICNEYIDAAFHFENASNILLSSNKSNKAIAINCDGVILSTLDLKNYKQIMNFLNEVNLLHQEKVAPKWIEDINMFDDTQQFEIIEKNNLTIKMASDNIAIAMEKINKNNEYKSILYTTGEELVRVVFEILENMLGCDLSQFEDKKKEDFSFEKNGIVYIGEIKGISSNVKSQNVSQLEFHHQGFIDEHPEIDDGSMRQILIINHQRNTPLPERDPVDRKQIELASRYGSLIVETKILLRMFEKYLDGGITQEECLDLLKKNIGLLEI